MPASGRSLLSEQQDKSPCSLLPRGSAQQLPFCQTLLSQLPKQSGPRWEGSCKTPGENSREPLIQTHSSLRIIELKNSLHTGLGFASRHTFYRIELATEMIFIFFTSQEQEDDLWLREPQRWKKRTSSASWPQPVGRIMDHCTKPRLSTDTQI